MGRQKAIELGATAAEAPPETAEQGDGPALSLFDASGDTRVRCLWRDPKTQKWTPHGYFPPGVTEETILKAFGGGDYWLQLLVQTENGEAIKQSRKVSLVGAHRIPAELPGINEPAPSPAAVVGTVPVGTNDLAQLLNASVLTTFIDLLKTMKEVNTRGPDPMMLKMMEMQGNVQSKLMELMLANGSSPKQETKKELLELMREMKELTTPAIVTPPGSGTPQSMLADLVGAIKQLKDVSEEFQPESSKTGDPVLDALPKLIEVMAADVEARKAALQSGVTPHASVPAKPSALQLPEGTPIWRKVLAREGPRLAAAAAAGRNPETIAAVSIEFMPASIQGAMAEFFHRPVADVVAQIQTEVPALAEFQSWLSEFVDHAQFLMFPDEFDEEGELLKGSGLLPKQEKEAVMEDGE